MNNCVVGLQWGDEGKGKVVDILAENADVVVRYGGGANRPGRFAKKQTASSPMASWSIRGR
jgi:hypothetical protein